MTGAFWCEHAWLGGAGVADSVLVEVEQGVIVSVADGVDPPAGASRLPGLTLPGFANGHSHAFHRVLRGNTQGGTGDFWSWRQAMYRAAEGLDPDSYHELAVTVFSEMLAAGYTVVGEFHYVHHAPRGEHYLPANAMGEALAAAADQVGIRLTLLDALYLHGGLDGTYLPVDRAQQRFSDGSADAWRSRWETGIDSSSARRGVAVHSVRAVDPAAMTTVAAMAGDSGLVVHAHVSEQPGENTACLGAHGRTPVEVMADAGLITERFTAVHGTHLTPFDIRILGEAKATVCMCPTTERDLADGIAATPELVAAGCRLSIGSDSQAVIDPFEETRAVELNQRLRTLRRGNHQAPDLLAAATRNGYESLGWADGGQISPGNLADLVTVSLASARLQMLEPIHMLDGALFAATSDDVASVIIGGVVRYRRGG